VGGCGNVKKHDVLQLLEVAWSDGPQHRYRNGALRSKGLKTRSRPSHARQLTIMRSAGASSPRWDCAGWQARFLSIDGTTPTTGIDGDRDKHALLEKSFCYC